MLEHALDYARHSLRIVPIGPGQKHPPLPAWQKAATSDPATITAWWTGLYRNHGIGIATGHDGLFVIDLDMHGTTNGLQTWLDLCDTHPDLADLDTFTVTTGNDGLHYYFYAPPGIDIRNDAGRRLGPGIDIRGIGGQVLAPPTVHPNGNPYRINRNRLEHIARLDADHTLIRLLTTPEPTQERTRERAPERASSAPGAPLGAPTTVDETPAEWFNRTTTWAELLEADGWTLRRTDPSGEQHWTRPGKDRRDGTSATVGYQGTDALVIFTTSVPQLDAGKAYSRFGYEAAMRHRGNRSELARTIRRTMPTVDRTGYDLTVTPGTPIPEVVDQDNPDALLGLLINWPRFWAKDHDDQQWLCDPIIPAGRSLAIYAPGGTGKSLFTLWVAACLATGRPILNHTGPPIHVLYLDYEMTEADLMERLENMGFGPDTDWSHLHYALLPAIAPLDDPAGAATIRALANLVNAELVIVDTFARAVAGDENEAQTVRDFYRLTGTALKAAGITMIRIDHAGKDITRGARGTSAKRDDVDIVWNLTALDAGVVQLKAEKRRVSWVPEQIRLTRHGEDENNLHWRLAPESQRTYLPGTADLMAFLDAHNIPSGDGKPTVRKALEAANLWEQAQKIPPKAFHKVLEGAIHARKARVTIDAVQLAVQPSEPPK